MKILKRKVVTKAHNSVSYVSVYFDHFKPIPLYHKESSYFGILKPIINEIFGLDYIPKYNPSYNPANLNNKLGSNVPSMCKCNSAFGVFFINSIILFIFYLFKILNPPPS